MRRCLLATVLMLSACLTVEVDDGEVGEVPALDGPTVEFDPASAIIPTPNNFLLDPGTGLVNIPPQCGENATQEALRTGVLNTLNGFANFKAVLQLSVTEPVAASSLAERIVLVRRATAGVPADPATEAPVPVLAFPDVSVRYTADCSSSEPIDVLRFVPMAPLAGNSTYVAVVLSGLESDGGQPFVPTPTWALVRQTVNPVTVEANRVVAERTPFDANDPAGLETLLGLDLLWKAHAGALAFADGVVDMERSEVLLAWEFNTQTTLDPLDVDIAESPAGNLTGGPPLGVASIAGGNAEALMEAILGVQACALIGCSAVGDVLLGNIRTASYQAELNNPLGLEPIPGPWSDPLNPALVAEPVIPLVAFVPATAPPPDGYPTIIFGHGLTRSKEDLYALAPQLAAAGFASIAIDWVGHGNRAVPISLAPALGCEPLQPPPAPQVPPPPMNAPQCYAPFLSPDLPSTRDNMRQAALDVIALSLSMRNCTGGACATLDIDSSRVGFVGQSVGALIGTVVAAMSPDIRAAILNVGGVGILDVVEHTDTLELKCPLVDALIAAGVVEGDPSDLTAMPPTGACTDDAYLTQPGYQSFAAAARWIVDSADGANYLSRLASKPVLVQKAIDDATVPNYVTEQQCALMGVEAAPADVYLGGIPAASAPILADPASNICIDYGGNPANIYAHSSLLAPADGTAQAGAGTVQMQTDAITYLVSNLQ